VSAEEEPAHEWRCPSCGATTRARMADHEPRPIPFDPPTNRWMTQAERLDRLHPGAVVYAACGARLGRVCVRTNDDDGLWQVAGLAGEVRTADLAEWCDLWVVIR
jgi:hypothetical protein